MKILENRLISKDEKAENYEEKQSEFINPALEKEQTKFSGTLPRTVHRNQNYKETAIDKPSHVM